MPKPQVEAIALPDLKPPLGESPAKLAKREIVKPKQWCPKSDIVFDTKCDPDNPKTVNYKDIFKASTFISQQIPQTPLTRSKHCAQFGMQLYYKYEIFHRTGSFHERGAFYSLSTLTDEQRQGRVYTASTGNWAMALAYYGQKLNVAITIVLPLATGREIVEKCSYTFGASVQLYGNNLIDAKKQAFTMIAENGTGTYINGYDHPNVIAASGSIGLEVLDQLPSIDAIIVPIGGGGLMAGIATAIKQIKPGVLVYGVETNKCCCFFKALENERPYQTEVLQSLADSLAAPTAGYNAFHTAKSLIDKMILVEDDWTSRGILHLLEEEKFVAEGAGAISLGALLAIPNILPELKDKNVVCIISGGNIDSFTLPRALERAKVVEGRMIKLTITLRADDTKKRLSILSMIRNVGCSIRQSDTDRAWICENDFNTIHEDFDEFCDPENPRLIKFEDVMDAANRLKPFIVNTPCMPSHYQQDYVMHLYYKLELLQKSGSFKERGSLNALQLLPLDKKKLGVVMASIGNDAAGLCYHASKINVPIIVVMPTSAPLSKLQKCHSLGAKVLVQGGNLLESQRYARAIARDKGLTYINGRDHPHILAGYGTIALEILDQVPNVDAVIVPVGCGGLAAAVTAVIKRLKKNCLVYGVQTDNMPVFFKSLENEEPMMIPMKATLGDAIAVTNVGVNAFANAQPVLDKMLLVNDDLIARSMLHLVEKERLVVEGAGACPLATIIGNLVPELKLKTVVCILSGGNIDSLLLPRCLDRGLAAEGRLVKFSVGIKDGSNYSAQLLKLLANSGYNLVSQFQDHVWMDDETYTVEMKLVCETKGLEHALELKRIVERAYPCTTIFETEPFNDRSTCPCYVRKSM